MESFLTNSLSVSTGRGETTVSTWLATRRDLLRAGLGVGAAALSTACAPGGGTRAPKLSSALPVATASRPDWRRGFQDLPREHGFEQLEVEGRIPEDLVGTLYRNGPALFSLFGRRYAHWFDGDGAVSAVRFGPKGAEGAVRLVQSAELQKERHAGRPLYGTYGTRAPGNAFERILARRKNSANTSVLVWQDRLFALFEGGVPTEIAPQDLSTIGATDLERAIPRVFTAHPHRVAARRTTYGFGLRYGRATELDLFALPDAGSARRLASIPLSRATMIHDFMATERHLVFFAPPLELQLLPLLLGRRSFSDSLDWRPSLGTEVLVVPIEQPESVTRFEVEPFYQWHFANAFERGDEIVVDLVRYPDFASNRWLGAAPTGRPEGSLNGTLHRAVVGDKALRLEQINGVPCEFPRVAPEVQGRPYRFAYVNAQIDGDAGGLFRGIAKVDTETARSQVVLLGEAQYPSEPVFVPSPDAKAEDDGYLLTLVYDAIEHRSHVAMLDARNVEREPLARAWFDHHIPFTFHGAWSAA